LVSNVRTQLADGATRIYGIIGDPIAQAKWPAVFNEKFRALGRNAAMIPLHAKPESFDACVRGLKSLANLDGLLVTLPFKTRIIAHVDTVLPAARRIGAINALRREPDGTWSGDMFDGKGFVGGLRASGVDPQGRSAMLIGAGSAGSAIADALAEAGASTIAIFDSGEGKAQDLAGRIAQSHPRCDAFAGPPTVEGVDVLINATPVGMAPGDGLPAAFGPLNVKMFVADIVPRQDATPLIALARKTGCRTMESKAMVTGQAEAILRFFGLV
jgi:shikimate dehydrogenase